MTVFCAIANQKGGVGKTTLTVHIASYLVEQGKRVVVIDGDPQANATSWLLSEIPDRNGIVLLLVARQPVLQACTPVQRWRLGLVSSSWEAGKALAYACDGPRSFDRVRGLIRQFDEVADYVLIDMPPSRLTGFLELLYSVDQVLMPTVLARFGIEGIYAMAEALAQCEMASRPALLGIVPNLYRYTNDERARAEQLFQDFGDRVWPAIPISTWVNIAQSSGETLWGCAPGEKVTRSMEQICRRVLVNS